MIAEIIVFIIPPEAIANMMNYPQLLRAFFCSVQLSAITIMPLWNDSVSLDVACLALAAQMP